MATSTEAKPAKRKRVAKVKSVGHRAGLVLTIDGTPYVVKPLDLGTLPPGCFRGFRLTRDDRRLGKVAHLIAEGIEGKICSCGDQWFHQTPIAGQCKHIRAAIVTGLL